VVVLYNDAGGAILASTASTTKGPTTTLSGAAAAEATQLTVSSSASFTRWVDLVVGPSSSTGKWEWCTVAGVGTNTIYLAAPLANAYPTGTAVKSHEITYSVPKTACATVARNCRAEWRYYVDGIERRESTIYHVSEYAPRLSLTAAELIQVYPRAIRQVASHQALDLMIRRMWHRQVLPAIGRMYAPGAIVSGEVAEQALVSLVKAVLCEEARDYESALIHREQYTGHLNEISQSMIDLNEDGVQTDAEQPRSLNSIRVLRG